MASQEIDVVRVGNSSIDGIVTNEDLATFLSTQAGSEIQDVQVNISKDNISLTGKMNVGMVFKGAVKLDGNLELRIILYYLHLRNSPLMVLLSQV